MTDNKSLISTKRLRKIGNCLWMMRACKTVSEPKAFLGWRRSKKGSEVRGIFMFLMSS